MLKSAKFFLGMLVMVIFAQTAVAETITLVADEWPPFNGKPDSENEGYMVDIARDIFEAKGYTVKYKVVPWARALEGTRKGLYNGVIAATKDEAEGFVFPAEELARSTSAFYVKKGNPWRFSDQDSLKDITLGTIEGYDYCQWLNDYIEANKDNPKKVDVMFGTTPLKHNLRKLLLGRIDVVVDNESTIRSVAKKEGLMDRIEPAGYLHKNLFCYIAFSPEVPESEKYARILSTGITELRANGKLQEILAKYGLNDWKAEGKGGIDTINIVTPQWEGQTNADGTGLFFEIVKRVYEPQGIKLNYHFVPWKRAMKMVRLKMADAMLCVWREDAQKQGHLIPRYPMSVEYTGVVFKKGNIVPWEGIKSLDGKTAVWLCGYDYHIASRLSSIKFGKWTEVNDYDHAWLLLANDRYDVYVDALIDLEHYIESNHVDMTPYRLEILWGENTYVAFAPTEQSRTLMAIYDTRIQKLFKSGELKKIYKKWGARFSPEAWKTGSQTPQ